MVLRSQQRKQRRLVSHQSSYRVIQINVPDEHLKVKRARNEVLLRFAVDDILDLFAVAPKSFALVGQLSLVVIESERLVLRASDDELKIIDANHYAHTFLKLRKDFFLFIDQILLVNLNLRQFFCKNAFA